MLRCRIFRRVSNVKKTQYKTNFKLDREDDKPAYLVYYKNGNVKEEEYWVKGLRHRENDKPARIFYHDNGTVQSEEYWVDNKRYREFNKPVIVRFNKGNETYVYCNEGVVKKEKINMSDLLCKCADK